MSERWRNRIGWLAVLSSTAIAGLWAFWGGIENFHEGWYHASLWRNIGMMFGQYLMPALLFIGMSATALRLPRVGGLLHVAAAVFVAWFFRGATVVVVYGFLVTPLLLMAAAYAFGRPRPRRWAYRITIGVPLLVMIASAAEPAWRVAHRIDDGLRGERRITQNGIDLLWAPAGPGWPDDGVSWHEARRRCAHLSLDGTRLEDTARHYWRLPGIDEAVRSMQRAGYNSGGRWQANDNTVRYERTPDKETPLWNPRGKVIYWWTANEVDSANAWIIVYDGKIWPRPKRAYWGYLGFRAVRSPDSTVAAR